MSLKVKDKKNRWRSKTVSFRVSPEEAEQLNILANLSGLKKQDYLINRVLQKDIVVHANSRVYKMLRDHLLKVLSELTRLDKINPEQDELFDLILYISEIVNGLCSDSDGIKN